MGTPVGHYVGCVDEGHAAVKTKEVEAHLDDTWFLWMGECEDSSAFYCRVHSPVLLIEYDRAVHAGVRKRLGGWGERGRARRDAHATAHPHRRPHFQRR